VLLALVSATGATGWWLTHRESAAVTHAPPAPSVSAPASAAATQPAVEALRSIEIGPLDPAAGYSRLLFGSGWLDPDGNGCDARNDILRRDLTGVELRPRTNGCAPGPRPGACRGGSRSPTTRSNCSPC